MIRQFELVELVKAYDQGADEAALNGAYVFAMKAHGAQKRASGDPYFSHPLEVAGILTETYGIEHPWWQMAGIVLLGPVWLFLVLAAWLRDGTGFGRTMEKLDVWLRMLLVLGIPASVAYASATERLQDTPWIAGKLMILAAIILFGLIMRLRFQGFFAGAASLVADGPSADVDRRMSASLRRARPFWLAIWLLLLAAALMGVVKPGDVESVPAAAVAKYPSDSRVTDPSVATRIVLAP